MFETTMVLVAERAAERRRATAADPLLARVARFGRHSCSGGHATSARAAPGAGRRRDYQRAA
jgi:hypothetical protein